MRVYECIWDSETRSFHSSYREAERAGRDYPGGDLIAYIKPIDFKPTKKGILDMLNHIA